jgi:hypothetical protein
MHWENINANCFHSVFLVGSSNVEVKEWVELYLHYPTTPPWRGDQLKHRDSFTFYLYPCETDFNKGMWNKLIMGKLRLIELNSSGQKYKRVQCLIERILEETSSLYIGVYCVKIYIDNFMEASKWTFYSCIFRIKFLFILFISFRV